MIDDAGQAQSPWCNNMMADSHFQRFFGTVIQCEIARGFLEA